MKIPGYEAGLNEIRRNRANGVKTDTKKSARKKSGGAFATTVSEAATVSVSSVARDIQRVSEVAKATPDVRADKVAAIAEKVRSGAYHVNSKKIAEKMLKDVLTQG